MERLLGGFPLEEEARTFVLKRRMEGSVKNEERDQNPLEGPEIVQRMVFAQSLERSRALLLRKDTGVLCLSWISTARSGTGPYLASLP